MSRVSVREGVRQGCLLPSNLFTAYTGKMMAEGSEHICAIKFTDDQTITEEMREIITKIAHLN